MTQPASLAQWLDYIQQLHPSEIDMGLDRLRLVAQRIGLGRPAPVVITVTGTNGKGSHVATLEALCIALGYRTAAYTSPHLLKYNERVRINAQDIDDASLEQAFSTIEQARGDISLSYFEFGTLAALMIFAEAALDVAILEVGLGGRLDAVNLVDADVAVISSIGLDHQEWLGDTRESVAREKAGIFRPGKPVICTEAQPPANLREIAEQLACPFLQFEQDFNVIERADGWQWSGVDSQRQGHWQLSGLPRPALQLQNVAGAVQAAIAAGLVSGPEALQQVLPAMLSNLQLAGRQQFININGQQVLLDVSHNPQAALALADTIARWRADAVGSAPGQVRLVLAMMKDKDHDGYIQALEKQIDFWYIAHFDLPRCMAADKLANLVRQHPVKSTSDNVSVVVFDGPLHGLLNAATGVQQAFLAACAEASPGDLLVVSGSFFTVSDVMQLKTITSEDRWQ
ncbi:bifunctional tetrahydrofolate synthase/dihydrofolate synthase [Pseudohongiella spirulinae]|uniref:Dihydrofolate synthase/folylpolyglutamate synthase n=1 Tax=Pseudohongiella spirulinae TaxID=1249552 RepID=A0A0S2KEW4_9GAMM|nr:bifunctional tetrahydrofolate synthase/dihydrofolate synthase [Pseudohongiella spirulinae]ALO46495.1 folylpolyglutamate synthase [Pseudohongiella spirulinae]